jgi:hypothetical protein
MKRKSVVSLIAIVAIVTAVIFAGCTESYTKIRDIHGNVDEYANKKVTVMGTAMEGNSGKFFGSRGFKVWGKTGKIWVDCEDYDGNLPVGGNDVIVNGIVRLKESIHSGDHYAVIEIDSWKYRD